MPFRDESSSSLTAADVANSLHCGLLARDDDYKIIFANDWLLEWLGYGKEELDGHPVEVLFPDDLRPLVREEQEATRKGDLRARITVLQRRNGTTFPVVVVGNPLKGNVGGTATWIALVIDLATVQTAKQATHPIGDDLGATLSRIGNELQLLGLSTASLPAHPPRLDHPALHELSPREREVLVELAAGHRVPAIAKRLFISPHTVRNHLKSIYRKVGVDSQVTLLEWLGGL